MSIKYTMLVKEDSEVSSRTYKRFLHPSPQRVNAQILSRLSAQRNNDNVVSLEVQERIHALMQHPAYYQDLRRWPRVNIRTIQGAAFDGLYPDEDLFSELERSLKHKKGTIHTMVRTTAEDIRIRILEQEEKWKKDEWPETRRQTLLDTEAVLNFQEKFGGRVATFGSARIEEGEPEYEAARWLNKAIATNLFSYDEKQGTIQEEHFISGAGPGIMDAANKGAMEGGLENLKKLESKTKGDAQKDLMRTFRSQMRSIGVRIQLPFETGWNNSLQANLSIPHFASRKKALIYTTAGQKVERNNDQEYEWHGRHPAVFVFKGGLGTRDEVGDVACGIQCGKIPEIPLIIVGPEECSIIEHECNVMEESGTISPGDRDYFVLAKDEKEAFEKYLAWHEIELSPEQKKKLSSYKPKIQS